MVSLPIFSTFRFNSQVQTTSRLLTLQVFRLSAAVLCVFFPQTPTSEAVLCITFCIKDAFSASAFISLSLCLSVLLIIPHISLPSLLFPYKIILSFMPPSRLLDHINENMIPKLCPPYFLDCISRSLL